jgi:hypothetical protein
MPAQRNKRNGRKPEVTSHPYSEVCILRYIKRVPDKTPRSQPTNKHDVSEPVVLGDRKPLEIFFSQYPEFQYQSGNSSVTEFRRLCEEYGWEKEDPKKKAARYEFNLAMKKEFDSLYGSDEKDINNWHKLCHVLSIDPVPDTLKECRAVSF